MFPLNTNTNTKMDQNIANELQLLKEKIQRNEKGMKELMKLNKECKERHDCTHKQFGELRAFIKSKDDTASHRLDICEKLLKFTNIQHDKMERAEIEQFILTHVDKAFKPTQKRVLELQSKMGSMSEEQVAINQKVGIFKTEMDEALCTGGKGPLKDQILSEVKKLIANQVTTINN